MTREERLLDAVRALANKDLLNKIAALTRKLKKIETARDAWKETALRYQKNLTERTK